VLSLLSSAFFHPQEHAVIQTLATKVLNYHGEGTVPDKIAKNPPAGDDAEGELDYNYIELAGLYGGFNTPLRQAATKIATRMHNTDVRVSENIIHDILLRCEENSLTCLPYKGVSARGQVPESYPLVLSKPGAIWVLRDYLNTVLKATPGEDFFARTIREMRHKHTPTQTLVLGHAMRTDKDNFHPHLLRTINTGPDPEVQVTAVDFSQLDAGYIKLHNLDIEPASLRVNVTDDLEMFKWGEYMQSLGRTQEEVKASPAEPSRLRHSPMTDWRCTVKTARHVLVPTDETDEFGEQIVQTLMGDDGLPVMETRDCGAKLGDCMHDCGEYPRSLIDCTEKQAKAPARAMKQVFELKRENTPPRKKCALDAPPPPKVAPKTTTTSAPPDVGPFMDLLAGVPKDKRKATMAALQSHLLMSMQS